MVIEQELDDVSVGVQRLKHLAVDMKQVCWVPRF